MMQFKLVSLFFYFTAVIFSHAVSSAEVKIYSKPVPAKELGAQIFPKQESVKKRSISFAAKSSEPAVIANNDENSTHLGLLINFAYNSAEILPESEAFIDEIGRMLSLEEYAQRKLVIEGHTDASGSEGYNNYLSKLRAESVKLFLMTHYQIAADRLLTKGMGESKLLADRSPYHRTNRRVEFYQAP